MNIHVGNLAYDVQDRDLRTAFSEFGRVAYVAVVNDPDTGQSRGFGFVEMESHAEAQTAIARLHGLELKGRNLTVREAKQGIPRPRAYSFR